MCKNLSLWRIFKQKVACQASIDIQIIQWSQNMYSIACQIQQCKTLNNQFCDKMAKQTRVTGGTYIYYLYESKIMMAQMTEFWFQTTNKNEYNFTCTMKPASTSHKFFSSSWGCRTERGRWSGGLCGYRLRLSDDQWRECRRDRNDKAGFGLDNSVLKRCWLWRWRCCGICVGDDGGGYSRWRAR